METHSKLSPLGLVQALLGLLLGGVVLFGLLLGLFHLAVQQTWLHPILEFPTLGLEMVAPIWAAFHLAQWIQERPRWMHIFALIWAALAIWSAWKLPDAQIFGRVWVFVPLLGLVLGLVPPSSHALQADLLALRPKPFRWGLCAGLIALVFSMGLASFLPDALTHAFPFRAQLALSGFLGIFVALMLQRLLDRLWPSLTLALLLAAAFILASLGRHLLIWRIPLRGTSLLWTFPGGLALGAALELVLRKRTGAGR